MFHEETFRASRLYRSNLPRTLPCHSPVMSPHSFEAAFGPLYVGSLLAMGLFGITTLQMYFYYRHYPKDEPWLKVLSGVVWILDVVHIALVGHVVYAYVIACFADPEAGMRLNTWSITTSLLLNVIIAVFSQCFFAHQIHTLCHPKHRWWVSSLVIFFVLAHFGSGVGAAVRFYGLKELRDMQEATVVSVIFGTTAVVSDIIIAVALCKIFTSNRPTAMKATLRAINVLILYAINRCILTSIAAIVEVALFRMLSTPFWAIAVDFVIGKLYINSYFAALNARSSVTRRTLRDEDHVTDISPSIEFTSTGSGTYSMSNITGTTDTRDSKTPGGKS